MFDFNAERRGLEANFSVFSAPSAYSALRKKIQPATDEHLGSD